MIRTTIAATAAILVLLAGCGASTTTTTPAPSTSAQGTSAVPSTAASAQDQVNAFLACILGGFSTFYGPVVGAVILPVVVNCVGFLANFKGFSNIGRWQMVIVYGLMLVVILIKPQGLFGKKAEVKV